MGYRIKELSKAEKELITHALAGTECDLSKGEKSTDPKDGHKWKAKRTIRAEVIFALVVKNSPLTLKDLSGGTTIHPKGLHLKGARIDGRLDLEGAEINCPLWFTKCFFIESIFLTDARTRTVNFEGSHVASSDIYGEFRPSVKLDGAIVDGSLYFDKGFSCTEDIHIPGVVINGDLGCSGAEIQEAGLNAAGIIVSGDVKFDKVEDDVNTRSGDPIGKNFQSLGPVELDGARVSGSLRCDNGHFLLENGLALSANGCDIKGDVFLSDEFTAMGPVFFTGAKIGGDLYCDEGKFHNSLIDDKELDGPIKAPAFNAAGVMVTGDVFFNECEFIGDVALRGADLGGDLRCERISIKEESSFDIETASIKGTLSWLPDKTTSANCSAFFEHAFADQLRVDPNSWPVGHKVNSDGFVYEALVDNSLTKESDWGKWLSQGDSKAFSSQSYEQLVRVFRKMGHNDKANKVAMQKQMKIGEIGAFETVVEKWWHIVMWETNRKGYEPLRVFRYITALFVLGHFVFWFAYQTDAMHPSKELIYLERCYRPSGEQNIEDVCEEHGWSIVEPWYPFKGKDLFYIPGFKINFKENEMWIPKEYPKFNPLAYSLDVVIPAFDLHQENYWLPSKGSPIYKFIMWGLIGLGWLFTTIGLVGFTEFIKRE